MQAIAREFNLSETTFVQTPRVDGATARVRIFVPTHEIPFAGHPVVGTAAALAAGGDAAQKMLFDLGAGLFPVEVAPDGDTMRAKFENPNPPAIRHGDFDPAAVAAALGLGKNDVDGGAVRPRLAGAGIDFLYVQTQMAGLAAARPNPLLIDDLLDGACEGILLYAPCKDQEADYQVRMFAPGAGILEDPATGSAACALAAQIAASGALPDGGHRWTVRQGVEMGRPSEIGLAFTVLDGAVGEVTVSGAAVPVQRGEIEV